MIQTMSITNLRNNIFDVFANLEKTGGEVLVEKDGKKVGVLKPFLELKFDWDNYKINLEKAVQRLSKYDWSDVLKSRNKFKARRYAGWSK